MRIRVESTFKWSPPEANKAWSMTFKPGEYTVTKACGERAVALGKAVEITRRRKGDD